MYTFRKWLHIKEKYAKMSLQYTPQTLLIINFLFSINYFLKDYYFKYVFAIFLALSMKFSVHNSVYL